MFETKKIFVWAQTIYCIYDTIYCFLITYLLLNTINFARSGICLSEVRHPPHEEDSCGVYHTTQRTNLNCPSWWRLHDNQSGH